MGKMQRQPLLQGLLTPQLPPQVARPFALLCNCRAETVPAHKTPMTSAAKNIDLIFLPKIAFLLVRPNLFLKTSEGRLFCWAVRLGRDEIAHACRKSRLNNTPAAQNIRTR